MPTFDELLSLREQQAPSIATGEVAPTEFDSLLQKREQDQGRLRAAAWQATQTTPDKAAQQQRLSNVTGLPLGFVQTDEGHANAVAKFQEINKLAESSPVLKARLMNPDFTVVAQDDTNVLGAIGDALTNTGRAVISAAPKFNEGAWGLARAGAELLPDVVGKPAATYFSTQGKTQRDLAANLMPKADGILGASWYSGMQSLGLNILQLPLGIGGKISPILTSMGLTTGGQAYGEARDKGVGIPTALAFGASQGVIEAGTEMLGLPAMLSMFKPGQFATKAMTYFWKEQLGEQIATHLQDLNEWAVLHPEKTLQNYIDERPSAALQTALATAFSGGGQIALGKIVQKGLEFSASDTKTAQAEQSTQHLGQLMALASQSKLRERSPQTFAEVSQELADNTEGAPTEVRFDARKLGEVLNQEEIAMLPSVASQMQEALATGGEVSVPIGELMANAAGTPLEQKLSEHARVGDNELSSFEAKEAATQAESYLQNEAKRVIAEATDSVGTQVSHDKVKQTVLDQLTSLGRFTKDVSEAQALTAASTYTALASRLGMTPEQVYEKYPLKVDGVNPAKQDVLNTVDQKPKVTYKAGKAPDDYALYVGRKKVGSTLVWKDGNQLKLESLYVDPKQRSTGVGSAALDAQLEIARGQSRGMESVASDVTNRRILDMLVRRLGQPEYVSDVYKEMTLEQARERLPAEPHPTSEDITGDAVFLRWPVSALETAKGYNQEPIPQTETKAFKEWFGDSKVVDTEGKPLVVMHASTYGDITAFKPEEQRFGKAGYGFYFSDAIGSNLFAEYGDKFQRGYSVAGEPKAVKTYPVYLNLKNPLIVNHVDDLKQYLDVSQKFGVARGILGNLDPSQLTRLERMGYDGIITRETTAPKVHKTQGLKILGRNDPKALSFPVYVVFNPAQIKSAIGNNGNFDPNDANILRQSVVTEAPKSATLEDFNSANVGGILGKDNWAILTAANPEGKQASEEQNLAANADLGADLKARGYEFMPSVGKYGNVEHGFIVTGIPQDEALLLGRKYNQDSVLTKAGLVYQDGSITPATNVEVYSTAPEDYYTMLPNGAMFQVGIDFDTKVEPNTEEQTEQRKMRQETDLAVLQPSESTGEKLASQTETKTFKNWFGDSKVVDAEGKPLVVYRGQPSEFNASDLGDRYFAYDPEYASTYGEGDENQNILPVYIKALNLKVEENTNDVTDWMYDKDGLISQGYDAVTDKSRTVIIPLLGGSQIKSAIGNNGEFSTNDANILRQSTAAPGSLNLTGVHFSKESRTTLDGRFYGSGLKGAERDRALNAQDKRLAERLYFYIDEGKGVRSESGVGGVAHESEIKNVYDLRADPLKLNAVGNLNQTESNILDAGFNGYYVSDAFNGQGVAVLLGQASRGVASSQISNPNQALPTPQAAQPYKRGLSSKELNSVDLEAVQKVAPSAQIKAGTFQVAQAELAAAQQAMADQGISLPNANTFSSSNARGTFNPSNLTISLLEGADLSTFHHELAHFYLEVLANVASQDNAPAAITADMDTLLSWFKIKDLATWNAMTLAQKRDAHEKFAEHFEHYLFEGKSPNTEMQRLFQRFASWMKSVYKSLSDFAVKHNTQLTPEVRSVYDRMLATDAQIEEAEATRKYLPLFKSAEEVGMTPEAWAQYQTLGRDATEDAKEALQKRSLRDLKWTLSANARALKDATKDVAAKRKAVETEVRAEVEASPVYAAWDALKAKDGVKISRAALGDQYGGTGEDGKFDRYALLDWKRLVDQKMTAEDGVHPDVVAEQFGFSSGDEMVRKMLETEPKASVIDGMTDQRLLERYGDLTTPQGIERAANEAVHNEARARFIATELAAISNANKPVNVILKAAKQFAEGLVASRQVRDLKPGKHRSAEVRAAKAAEKAMATGDTQAAIVAKRDQMLQFYAGKMTAEAQDEIERKVKNLKKISESDKLPIEYRDQIDKLLERVELKERTLRELDKRARLAEWVKSQEEIGVEPDIPAYLLEDSQLTNYKDMTVEEFRGLYDTVKQIEHLGRLKNKLLLAKDQREFAAIRDDIAGSITKLAGDRKADTRTPTTTKGKWFQSVKNFFSAHIRAAMLARELDAGKDGGKVWEYFIRPANERSEWETTRRAEATEALTGIMAPWLAKGNLSKKTFYPAINRSLTRQELFAIALNTGNASNLQRLLGGEGWTQQQLDNVLNTLDSADWATAQKVWDYMGKFWPKIEAKHLRVYGVRLEKIPHGSNVTERLGIAGGYYPIKYDPAASVRAEEHADAEGAQRLLKGAYGAATTKRSFTKARVDEVSGRPLLYNLSGLYSGVNDVLHDLAWHEWLIDTNRLLKSTTIDTAIREHYGPAYIHQLKTWRDAIAEGDAGNQQALGSALGWLRQSVSIAGLGFNVMSAAMQPLGMTLSIQRVGAKWVGNGLANYVSNPARATREAQEMSEFMRNRGRTQFRDLNELRNRVQGEDGALDSVRKNAYFLMMKAQQTVDVPTWHGAYEKALSEGNDSDRAVILADQAVIDSQGGGEIKDLSAIERGGPAQKLFTTFYSFMNTSFNLGHLSARTDSAKGKAAALLLVGVMPAVLATLLKDVLTPGDGGDDDWKKLAKKLAGEQLSYLMGLMVVSREFGEAGKTMLGVSEHPRDYSGPAGVRMISDATVFAKQVNQGEFDDSFRKAAINLLGDVVGLPSAQINRTVTGFNALKEGKTKNPAALAFGYQEPK